MSSQGKKIAGYRVHGGPGHPVLEVGKDEAADAIAFAENYRQPLIVVFSDGSESVYVRRD